MRRIISIITIIIYVNDEYNTTCTRRDALAVGDGKYNHVRREESNKKIKVKKK